MPAECPGKRIGDIIINSAVISPTFTGEEKAKAKFAKSMVEFLKAHAYMGFVLLSGTHESQMLKKYEKSNFDGAAIHKVLHHLSLPCATQSKLSESFDCRWMCRIAVVCTVHTYSPLAERHQI